MANIGIDHLRRHGGARHQQADRGGIVRTRRGGGQAGESLRPADADLLVQTCAPPVRGCPPAGRRRRSARRGGPRPRRSRTPAGASAPRSKISSRRAWMMRVSMERGTRSAASSPSSPIWGTATTSAPASMSPSAAPNSVLIRSAADKRRRQHAGNVGGDGEAAHRHDIGMDQMAFQEDGDGGDSRRPCRSRWRRSAFRPRSGWQGPRHRRRTGCPTTLQMAALHRQLEILQRAGLDRHRMHGDADALAEHAGGIAHAARLVHHIGGRRALDDLMAFQRGSGRGRRPAARADARPTPGRRPAPSPRGW